MKVFDRAALSDTLNSGVAELGLELNVVQRGQLLDYLALLAKWNTVYNLTSVRDPAQMVVQHVLDSLAAVSAFAAAKSVLDVGASMARQRSWEKIDPERRVQFQAASSDKQVTVGGHVFKQDATRINDSVLDAIKDLSELDRLPCLDAHHQTQYINHAKNI